MNQITIIQATITDLETLQRISEETFVETFADSNTEADMAKYLADSFNHNALASELNNPDSLFFIAWDGGQAVGYLKLNTANAQTEPLDHNALEIERIYVRSSYHGQQVGQLLYHKAIEISRLRQSTFIWLGVWEKNARAIRFYEKNGFATFDQHIFKVGDDEQIDVMMKKEL